MRVCARGNSCGAKRRAIAGAYHGAMLKIHIALLRLDRRSYKILVYVTHFRIGWENGQPSNEKQVCANKLSSHNERCAVNRTLRKKSRKCCHKFCGKFPSFFSRLLHIKKRSISQWSVHNDQKVQEFRTRRIREPTCRLRLHNRLREIVQSKMPRLQQRDTSRRAQTCIDVARRRRYETIRSRAVSCHLIYPAHHTRTLPHISGYKSTAWTHFDCFWKHKETKKLRGVCWCHCRCVTILDFCCL